MEVFSASRTHNISRMSGLLDTGGSDNSPTFSESIPQAWQPVWDHEGNLPGQHYGGALNGLHDLVEDKDVAAKAVALVVNSTRKGIVPLCADVARLLKQKKLLESKVERLRSENESLRSSRSMSYRTSQSTSPPLSDRGSFTDKLQPERSRPCSRCSSHASSLANRSPRQKRVSAFTKHSSNDNSTCIDIHAPYEPPLVHSSPQDGSCDLTNRKNSLPEIVSEPQGNITKVNPRRNTSVEVQCNLDGPGSANQENRDAQFREALLHNSRLAEDLGAAKREIQLLQEKMNEMKLKQKEVEDNLDFRVEDETKPPKNASAASRERRIRHSRSPRRRRPFVVKHVSEKTVVSLGHHVITKGDKTGYVRYMGHMNGKTDRIFVGIELDEPAGRHDGSLNGKRYFTCRKGHGIFLPLEEVISIIEDRDSPDPLSCQKPIKVLRRRERTQERRSRQSLPSDFEEIESDDV